MASANPHTAHSRVDTSRGALRKLLAEGDLRIDGRLVDSSNNAMLGHVVAGGQRIDCVYKPVAGERPLWDFPDGTLTGREVAAAIVAQACGWPLIPVTVFRSGPLGPGMVQQWIAPPAEQIARPPVIVCPAQQLPAGYLPVFSAIDADEQPLLVAHQDTAELKRLAVFDVIVNNADRKGSHILADSDICYAVDHGLTFHVDPKLRTILWGWAGQPLPAEVNPTLSRLRDALVGPLAERLSEYLSAPEIQAVAERLRNLVEIGHFPLPPTDRMPLPWPPL